MEIMEKAIRFACDTGVRIIQLAGYDVYYEEGGEDTRARFAENLHRCVEIAARYGVTLGVAFAANLLTMYVFFEMLTLVTIPLVTLLLQYLQ